MIVNLLILSSLFLLIIRSLFRMNSQRNRSIPALLSAIAFHFLISVLLYDWNYGLGILIIWGWLYILFSCLICQKEQKLFLVFITSIVFWGVLFIIPWDIFSPSKISIEISSYYQRLLQVNIQLRSLDTQALLFILGLYFSMTELNALIRFTLNRYQVSPTDTNGQKNTDELNRGRIIGVLERGLIYSFVFMDNYEAVGYILAAKGIIRFKTFTEDKDFSEYVLIGTLLSATTAFFSGKVFQFFSQYL